MQYNEVRFTQDIYSEHLTTINRVNFTPREIDVISCLLNARRTNQIASILSIAPRTVTTHFRNIMLRLDCNSQEGIISFIERSQKLSILREYYASLITEIAFKKSLKNISKLKHGEIPHYLVIYWEDQKLKDALLHRLSTHLDQAGIEAEVRQYSVGQNVENLKNPSQVLLLLLEKKEQGEVPLELADSIFTDLFEYKNYYSSVFEIFKMLLPNINLEDIFTNFKEYVTGLQGSVRNNKYNVLKQKVDRNKDGVFHKLIQTFKNRKWYFIVVFFVIILSNIQFFFIKGNNRQEQKHVQDLNVIQEKEEVALKIQDVLFRKYLKKISEKIDARFRVFIAYSWDSKQHKEQVKSLASNLVLSGVPAENIWLDVWASRPGGGISLSEHAKKILEADKVLLITRIMD